MSRAEYDDGYSLGFVEAAEGEDAPLRPFAAPDTEDWARGYLDGREAWCLAAEGVSRV